MLRIKDELQVILKCLKALIRFYPELLAKKAEDHGIPFGKLIDVAETRINDIRDQGMPDDSKSEMMRFVSAGD